MTRWTRFAALAVLIPLQALAGQEVGEWGPDADACRFSRLVFTNDGRHESRMLADGSWQTLASAPYHREGDMLTIENAAKTEQIRILDESSKHLVLQNLDAGQQGKTGQTQVRLVRCGEA